MASVTAHSPHKHAPLACLLWILGLAVLFQLQPAMAQEVTILKSADVAAYNQAVAGIKAQAKPTIRFTEYSLQGSLDRGRKLARKVRASKAELVFAVGLKAALAAKLEILDIPVVFCMVLNPAKYELTAQNMTGVLLETPKVRIFSTVQTVLPAAKRIGVLYDPEKTSRHVDDARLNAKALGLKLVARPVRSEKEVPGTLRSLINSVEALWLLPDTTVLNQDSLKFILSTSLESQVPVIGFSSDLVRGGALLGLFVNYEDVGRQASLLAEKILDGQVTLPRAATPAKDVRIAINLKTANFLGIPILPEVVRSADKVY